MSNCGSCGSAGGCSKCSAGYYLAGGSCVECTGDECTCGAVQTYVNLYKSEPWNSLWVFLVLLLAVCGWF